MLKGLLSVFLKSNCPLCQRATVETVCQSCEKQLLSCRQTNPARWWQGNIPLFAWGIYQGRLKSAIATMKYNNSPQLGELFGYWLGETWLSSPLGDRSKKLTVIPIPLHASKLQTRGFNQAEIIAKNFCQITGDRLQTKVLERVRSTQAMFGLNFSQRQTNLSNAFQVSPHWQKQLSSPVLLVDDIYTTGTTIREATKVLRENKAVVCGVAAIAAPEQLNYKEG
jgi:ComF family protein